MIRLTNLADYAVVLMCQFPSDAGYRVSAVDLAEKTELPVPSVSKILNALARADLLVSHRGLKGGFSLSRAAVDISVAEIIEAVDGPISLTHCVDSDHSDCSVESVCAMRPHWQTINQAVRGALDGIRLSDINMQAAGTALAQQLEAKSAAITALNADEQTVDVAG